MARRTAALKPQLNQIRTWAREGRTDAWIAYQLGTTSVTVQEFRFEYGLDKGPGNPVEEPVTPELVVQTISFDSPPPLPQLEPAAPADESAEPAPTRRQRRSRPVKADEQAPKAESESESESAPELERPADGEGDPDRPKRRRRRGGRGAGTGTTADGVPATEDARPEKAAAAETRTPAASRRKTRTPASYQGSVVAGAVLVLDPAVTRSAAWRAHWADAPAFDVVVEEDQIVLRRRSAD